MARSRVSVGVASVVGSFVIYGAHVACGGGGGSPIARAPAQQPAVAPSITPSASVATTASASGDSCGCSSGAGAKTSASFVVSGDEKMTLDPADSSVDFEVTNARGPGGKKLYTVSVVVRAYRSDVLAERPTTFAIRATLPEGATAPAAPKDVEAYVTTWVGSTWAPRSFATLQKHALTFAMSPESLEIRGSITLKDVPTGRTVVLDKVSIKKSGSALLPPHVGAFKAP